MLEAVSAIDAVLLVIAVMAVGLVGYLAAATGRLRRLQREQQGDEFSTAARAEAERLLSLARELSRDTRRQAAPGAADDGR